MHNIFLFVFTLATSACIISCGSDTKTTANDAINNPATADAPGDTSTLPRFQWDKEVHDFGTITQGERVSYAFTFTNTGKSDLVISSAKGSCGCTVPEWSKDPVKPGDKGKIDVVFDSDGKSGHQEKRVTVMANTNPNTVELKIIGEVEVPNLESKKE